MFFGIQILGVLFALFMIYLTYHNFKRNSYNKTSLFLWLGIWLVMLIVVIVPQTVYGVMETLAIQSTADFISLFGLLFFAVVVFYLYTNMSKLQSKMEDLVRAVAIENAQTKFGTGKSKDLHGETKKEKSKKK